MMPRAISVSSPRVSSDSWDHEVAIRGVYRRWLDMIERGMERHHD